QMHGRAEGFDPDALTLQLENAVNPFVPEHFEAADMHGTQADYRQATIERADQHRGEIRTEIDLAARDRLGGVEGRSGIADVADIGKTLGPQQLLGHV